ncbi:MAG: hypothetical protein J5J00_08845 [Deltaproteobacteria bacterium]|nr:hypothetical protein [Deltaproteobacteria bacterium]
MKRSLRFAIFFTAFTGGCILATSLFGCGGGGGGSNFAGAALVRISAQPRTIDVGDQTQIRITISDVHQNGIALKIRYPSDLEYVRNSAILQVEGEEVDLAPAVNTSDGDDTFLVFFLSNDTFGKDDRGELFVELEGKAENEDAGVEVDADVDDPDIDNDSEFSVDMPEFSAEDEIFIFIAG